MVYVVADIGGTKLRMARSTDLERFDEPLIFDTPKTYNEGITLIKATAQQLAEGEIVEAAAFGVPGVLSRDRRSFLRITNLPDWSYKAFADEVESAIGAKVYLQNDTAVVGLGEAVFGAGKGVEIVMYLTVSTGVNGVRTVNGRIDASVYGFELAYQCVSIDDRPLDWGNLISGTAVEKKYGKPPKELGKEWPHWEELARLTAIGLNNSIVHWSPDRVVLGGSMFNPIGISVERVQYHLKQIMTIYPEIPEIVHSQLGAVGGLWGGLALLKGTK